MSVRVKIGDKFGVNTLHVEGFNAQQRQPDGYVNLYIDDIEGASLGQVTLTAEGVRDLITALEYAALYQAGEV